MTRSERQIEPIIIPREPDKPSYPQRDINEVIVEQRILAGVNKWLESKPGRTSAEYYSEFERLAQWWQRKKREPLATLLLIGDKEAREFAAFLANRMGPAGINRALAALSSLWRFLQVEGLVENNPFRTTNVPRPTVPDRTSERILTEEEVQRLISYSRTPKERALILLLYHTGLRVSEAIKARWEHLQQTPNGWVLVVPRGKGGRSRTVGISTEAIQACLDLHDYLGIDQNDPRAQWLIPGNSKEGHIARTSAERIVARVAKRAGIRSSFRPVSPHWLRHSHATHALQRGADIAVVRAQLGHASLATTTRYLHARPDVTSTDYLPGASRKSEVGEEG